MARWLPNALRTAPVSVFKRLQKKKMNGRAISVSASGFAMFESGQCAERK
jgi:hypothetical protein